MGESYGGTRAAVIAAQAEDIEISGVLLLSPALDFSAGAEVVGNNLPYIFRLPSMAVTAAYHGVTDAGERSFLDVFNEAADYAQSEYTAALYKGHDIDPAEKRAVALHLAALTGLAPDYILDSNLRIDAGEFRDRLLADDGMRIGRLDTRATGLLEEFKDKRPPGDDPSMSGRSTGGRSTGEVLDEYYSESLGVRIDWPYRTLNLDLNSKWDFGQKRAGLKTYFSVVPQLQDAMQSNPNLRVFVGGGIFDLGTPIMAARFATSQVDASPDRFMFGGYEGGHTTFEHEASRIALCDDIREFMATTVARAAAGETE
jgi:carboxypeptidase C (cathepsin A)